MEFLRYEGVALNSELWHPPAFIPGRLNLTPLSYLNGVSIGLFTAGLAAVLIPECQLVRIGMAVFFLLQVSVEVSIYVRHSYGGYHDSHALLYVTILLAFAPSWGKAPSRLIRERVLRIFFYCQVMLAGFYSASGLWRVVYAFHQFFRHQPNAFQVDAYSRLVASKLITGNSMTMLGPWVIEHDPVGFLGMWVITYIEVVSILAVFRPSLHRIWGALLILFHVLCVLTLSPNFDLNVFLLGLFFLASPFHPRDFRFREALTQFPGAGLTYKLFSWAG